MKRSSLLRVFGDTVATSSAREVLTLFGLIPIPALSSPCQGILRSQTGSYKRFVATFRFQRSAKNNLCLTQALERIGEQFVLVKKANRLIFLDSEIGKVSSPL